MCKAAEHQGLAQCTKLPKLIVSKATKYGNIGIFGHVGRWMCNVKEHQGLTRVIVTRVIIYGCSDLEELASMETLVCLESLLADECVNLKRIKELGYLRKPLDLGVAVN